MKIIKIIIMGLFLMTVSFQYASSEVVFQDNFDGFTSGWTPSGGYSGHNVTPCVNGTCGSGTPPTGWNGYMNHGSATPSIVTDKGRHGTPCLQIAYDYGGAVSSQCGLIKWLGAAGYDELYIRWYWKYGSGFKYGNGTNGSFQYHKLMRIWCGVDLNDLEGQLISNECYFNHVAMISWNDDSWNTFHPFVTGKFWNGSISTQSTNAYGEKPTPGDCYSGKGNAHTWWKDNQSEGWMETYTGNLIDGAIPEGQTWHCTEVHIKLRSDIDTKDSIFEVWIDGNKLPAGYYGNDLSDPPFVSNEAGRMNYIHLNDNFNGAKYWTEQEYLWIDDFVVSTTHIGPVPEGPGNPRFE
ncbi:MAG: hypothetical protein ACTSX1_12090 [Candidatus Heimdallarchaeaceae archaeon]